MSISEAQVQAALKRLVDPNTGTDFVTSRSARNIRVSGSDVSVDIELGYPGKTQFEPIRKQVVEALREAGATAATVNVTSKVVAHAVQKSLRSARAELPNVS